jgi:hypothetical protein
MYCARCDRWEDDQIALECEICTRCGGPLVVPDQAMTGAKSMKRKRDRTQPVNWSAPEDRLASLQAENWQLKQALGYPIPADKETPQNPFRCGTCDARQQRVAELEAELARRPNAG